MGAPLGLLVGLQQEGRDGTHQSDLGHAALAVPADVAGDLAPSHGVAHQGDVLQVERVDQRGEIVGEGVVVVPRAWLAGPAEAAAVLGHDAKAVLRQEHHLVVPRVRRQRIAVREDDNRPAAPVLVVEDGAVLGRDAVGGELGYGGTRLGQSRARTGFDRNGPGQKRAGAGDHQMTAGRVPKGFDSRHERDPKWGPSRHQRDIEEGSRGPRPRGSGARRDQKPRRFRSCGSKAWPLRFATLGSAETLARHALRAA